MIYISIPDNCTFFRAGEVIGGLEESIESSAIDRYAYHKDGSIYIIALQDIVKDAIRGKKYKAQETTIYCNDHQLHPQANRSIDTCNLVITVYHKRPAADSGRVLMYLPNDNAKQPTAEEPTVVSEKQAQATAPRTSAVNGTLWYRLDPAITRERREVLDAKAAAQRESRRNKVADNPFAV